MGSTLNESRICSWRDGCKIVEKLHIVTAYHLPSLSQALFEVRGNWQMHMAGHQHIGMNRPAMFIKG
jgi:hypothetical protein